MPPAQITAAIILVALWSGVGWTIDHHRRIERELVKDEAMPRPGPRANFVILVCAVLTGLSGLLLYFIVG